MKKLCSLILVILVITILSGCTKEEKGHMTVAYFANVTHSQALIMKNQKMLEKELGNTYNVGWKCFNAGPDEVEALFSGEVDIGYIGPVPAINANVKSEGDIQIISNAADGGAVLIKREGVAIQTVKDLGGKKVAIPQLGNTQHLSLLALLKENDMSPVSEGGTVNVVAVANADLQNLLERGDIDAALVPEPWGTILEANCGAVIVLDYDEIYMNGNYPTAVVVVRKEYLNKNKEAVEKFLKVNNEAVLFIKNDTPDAIKAVCDEIKQAIGKEYNANIIKSSFSKIKFNNTISKEAMKGFIDIAYENKFITKLPDNKLYY